MNFTYTANQFDAGKTVKETIYRVFPLSSRTLSKLKNTGGICVNGKPVTVRFTLSAGDILSLSLSEKSSHEISLWDKEIEILFENNDFIAVNKPHAMPTHPCSTNHSKTLANAVMYHYKDKEFTFRPVTRLDADTTGVVLIAKNAVSCAALSSFLSDGSMKKQYLAICTGIPNPLSGTIDAPIERETSSVIKRRVSPTGKPSVTMYETLKVLCDGKYSLVRCYPQTGRTHQIRLHMSHIGCPLYGDFLYGTQTNNERALLHCEALSFPDLGNKKNTIIIKAPLPYDFERFCGILPFEH